MRGKVVIFSLMLGFLSFGQTQKPKIPLSNTEQEELTTAIMEGKPHIIHAFGKANKELTLVDLNPFAIVAFHQVRFDKEVADALIKYGVKIDEYFYLEGKQYTPFSFVIRKQDDLLSKVKYFLDNGADPMKPIGAYDNLNVFFLSFFNNIPEDVILEILKSRKVDVNRSIFYEYITFYPLTMALMTKKSLNIVKTITEKGADLNAKITVYGQTINLLNWAYYCDANDEILSFLYNNGARRSSENIAHNRAISINDLKGMLNIGNISKASRIETAIPTQTVPSKTSNTGKHIEFREDRSSSCGDGFAKGTSVTVYKVYKNGEIYHNNASIQVSSYDGKWSNYCKGNGILADEVLQSQMTLKQYLIRRFETGTGKADSYTLTTK